jgi:uncharacterized protein YdaU (DUF1376 family)
MAKQQAPAFQLYAQDFLAGTADMTPDQVGVYIRLLCHQWIRKGLPNDDAILSRLSGAETDVLSIVRKKFSEKKNGLLQNKRLEIERKKQREYSRKQAENANKGWEKRRNATAMPPHDSGISQNDALHPHLPSHPHPLPSGLIPGGVVTNGNGHGRAGLKLPPPDAVRKLFSEMDPAAVAAMPGAAIQKACMFVGLHRSTADRATARSDIDPEYFLRQYAEVCGDSTLKNPLSVLAVRLRLNKPRHFKRQEKL